MEKASQPLILFVFFLIFPILSIFLNVLLISDLFTNKFNLYCFITIITSCSLFLIFKVIPESKNEILNYYLFKKYAKVALGLDIKDSVSNQKENKKKDSSSPPYKRFFIDLDLFISYNLAFIPALYLDSITLVRELTEFNSILIIFLVVLIIFSLFCLVIQFQRLIQDYIKKSGNREDLRNQINVQLEKFDIENKFDEIGFIVQYLGRSIWKYPKVYQAYSIIVIIGGFIFSIFGG